MKSGLAGATMMLMALGSAQAQTIGGSYQVEGTNLDGSSYSGTAQIDVTSATTCRIAWDTGTSSSGICMVNQNAFAAAYVFESGAVGLVVYELMQDGTLDGVWTIADTAGAGTETLTPIE
ncbi:hypothetical protein OEG84_02700 [Hoeflea sp. G2-23]|uniref:Avidin n=2 Tax=Hoeflea algicola TaxID=2983763 RepID=A0ABT3Z4F9_9HYPH|nr:hypothetical protein [Hoeflea algicola]